MSNNMQLLAFSAVSLSPLAVTSAVAEPKLLALGALLQLGLGCITVNSLPKEAVGITSVEKAAIAKLVTTSTTNRLTRLALGSVHLWAAVALASRHTKRAKEDLSGELHGGALGYLKSAANLGGTLVLCLAAAVWISSGYYGQ